MQSRSGTRRGGCSEQAPPSISAHVPAPTARAANSPIGSLLRGAIVCGSGPVWVLCPTVRAALVVLDRCVPDRDNPHRKRRKCWRSRLRSAGAIRHGGDRWSEAKRVEAVAGRRSRPRWRGDA
jgi:hypothetical protein